MNWKTLNIAHTYNIPFILLFANVWVCHVHRWFEFSYFPSWRCKETQKEKKSGKTTLETDFFFLILIKWRNKNSLVSMINISGCLVIMHTNKRDRKEPVGILYLSLFHSYAQNKWLSAHKLIKSDGQRKQQPHVLLKLLLTTKGTTQCN